MVGARRAIVIFASAAIALVALLVWQPWLPRVEVGGVRINPHAKIHKAKTYKVIVWDYELPITWSSVTHAQAMQVAVTEFTRLYPNIQVELVTRQLGDDDGAIRDSLEKGNPPDVLGMPGGIRLIASEYQVPLEHFLSEDEASDLFASARHAATQIHLWGFPRWINPSRWVLRTDRWPSGTSLFAPGSEPPTLTTSEWEEALANARTKTGSTGIAVNVLDPAFFYDLMVSATGTPYLDADHRVLWSQESIQNVASMLRDWVQKGLIAKDLESASRTRLARFWTGNAVALAPTTSWLLHHMLQRSGTLASPEGDPASPVITNAPRAKLESTQRSVVWTTPPQFRKELAVPATVSGYAVFRQAEYKGNDHTQAAATVARFLSRNLGAWEAVRIFAVPAHPSSVPEWISKSRLPEQDMRALLTWSAAAVAPPVDDETARLQARILAETAVPNLIQVMKGQMTPEQFAQELAATPVSALAEVAVP